MDDAPVAAVSASDRVSLVIAIVALLGSGVAALAQMLGKRGETRVTNDANLRDDQREYISVLQKDNQDLRARVTAAEQERVVDHRRIYALEQALRDANIPIPVT